jgi:hypothetical protein
MRNCHSSGGLSPASYHGCPDSLPGHSMWDFIWTKWHWDRFSSESFGVPVLVSFQRCSMFSHVTSERWTRRPLEAQLHRCLVLLHHSTDRDGPVVNIPASYSGGSVFKSRSGDRISLLRFFVVFLSPPAECRDSAQKLSHDRCPPNPFRFIIHLTSNYSTLYSLSKS